MISMVIYSEDSADNIKIKKIFEDVIHVISEQKWDIKYYETLRRVERYLLVNKEINLLIFDITAPKAIIMLEELRRRYEDTFLLIIADTNISPMMYMKPNIRATSLILRPIEQVEMQDVIKAFLIDFIEKHESEDKEHIFKIESKGEVKYIPYESIYYFEARKRKIYLRTLTEEYIFSSTVDSLEQMLGEQFIRCHRSFIVNSRKIVSIVLSENIIKLTNDIIVPLSRGYKSSVKQTIEARKTYE